MRFSSLGSGSEGNGLVVESGGTRVLIDCGFGLRDTASRLARLGLEPQALTAILVTHEHADHGPDHGGQEEAPWGSIVVAHRVAHRSLILIEGVRPLV